MLLISGTQDLNIIAEQALSSCRSKTICRSQKTNWMKITMESTSGDSKRMNKWKRNLRNNVLSDMIQ